MISRIDNHGLVWVNAIFVNDCAKNRWLIQFGQKGVVIRFEPKNSPWRGPCWSVARPLQGREVIAWCVRAMKVFGGSGLIRFIWR
jgi:hypothetical protein